MIALLKDDAVYADATRRIDRMLVGPEPTPESRVALVAAGAGLMLAGVDASLDDLDDATLRAALAAAARRVLGRS